jgi:hypothetical protein
VTSPAGDLEPYGAEVRLSLGADLDTRRLLEALLEDIARSCEAAGASIVGHIKCVLRTRGKRIHCSVTSFRAGARCGSDGAERLEEGREVELKLAVLVYGLSATIIDGIVEAALGRALAPTGSFWSKRAFFRDPNL